MSFIDTFNLLKKNYEQKPKPENEKSTYDLLRILITKYGYDSVCDEISFYNDKNESKNKELSIFMAEVKKRVSMEVLCSQLYYLDNSVIFSEKSAVNHNQINIKKINTIKSLNNGKNNNTYKFKVMKNQKNNIW